MVTLCDKSLYYATIYYSHAIAWHFQLLNNSKENQTKIFQEIESLLSIIHKTKLIVIIWPLFLKLNLKIFIKEKMMKIR